MLGTILIIVLILLLIGASPSWGHSRSWGYGPSGGLGLVLIVVIVLGAKLGAAQKAWFKGLLSAAEVDDSIALIVLCVESISCASSTCDKPLASRACWIANPKSAGALNRATRFTTSPPIVK